MQDRVRAGLMRAALAAALLLWTGAATALPWATREACTVSQPRLVASAFDGGDPAPILAAGAQVLNGKGRLWQVTAPSGAVSHLWGTFHSNDPLILDLPEEVETLIEGARVVAVEIDFTDRRRTELETLFSNVDIFAPPRSGGPYDLNSDVRDWIQARTRSLGWGAEALRLYRPSVVMDLILGDPCNDFRGGTYPIQDARIQMLGHIAGAEVLGLEPQKALAENLDAKDARPLVRAMFSVYGTYLQPGDWPAGRASSYHLYLTGQIGAMMAWDEDYVASVLGPRDGPEMHRMVSDYLLAERNRDFLAAALPGLRRGGMFIAVGCFHLPESTGLVEMLRAEGFSVTRIPLPGEMQ